MNLATLPAELSQSIYNSTVLIVEDNELSRRFLERILTLRGFTRVHSVVSGEDALEQLAAISPDLVLLDILMPGMDGFECCAQIRRNPRYADMPILMQTAITEPELRAKAFAAGANDFVNKPIYPEELCARMAVHLEMRHSLRSLRHYKQRIAMELESARLMQQSILPGPDELAMLGEFCGLEVAAHYQPSSEIGGDIWGIKRLFPQQSAVWMVDFSGHGVASALNAFRLQAYLREHSMLAAKPGDYMALMNEKLLQLLQRGQFATMFYGIIDAQANQLLYACAATPSPTLLRHDTGAVEMLEGRGHPLGIGIYPYPAQSVRFAMGDVLVLYSDALIETADAHGAFLTEEAVASLVRAQHGASAETIKNSVLHAFHNHAAAAPADDLTLVVCKRQVKE